MKKIILACLVFLMTVTFFTYSDKINNPNDYYVCQVDSDLSKKVSWVKFNLDENKGTTFLAKGEQTRLSFNRNMLMNSTFPARDFEINIFKKYWK